MIDELRAEVIHGLHVASEALATMCIVCFPVHAFKTTGRAFVQFAYNRIFCVEKAEDIYRQELQACTIFRSALADSKFFG